MIEKSRRIAQKQKNRKKRHNAYTVIALLIILLAINAVTMANLKAPPLFFIALNAWLICSAIYVCGVFNSKIINLIFFVVTGPIGVLGISTIFHP